GGGACGSAAPWPGAGTPGAGRGRPPGRGAPGRRGGRAWARQTPPCPASRYTQAAAASTQAATRITTRAALHTVPAGDRAAPSAAGLGIGSALDGGPVGRVGGGFPARGRPRPAAPPGGRGRRGVRGGGPRPSDWG